MQQSIALVEKWQLLDMGNAAEITQPITITSSGVSEVTGLIQATRIKEKACS